MRLTGVVSFQARVIRAPKVCGVRTVLSHVQITVKDALLEREHALLVLISFGALLAS